MVRGLQLTVEACEKATAQLEQEQALAQARYTQALAARDQQLAQLEAELQRSRGECQELAKRMAL
jgi:hypothetical protein